MKNMEHAFVNKCVDEHWGDIIDAIENGAACGQLAIICE